MKNKFLLGLASILALVIPSCGNKGNSEPIKYDYTYFNGICALTGDFNNGVDVGLTNVWTAKATKALGAKSFRLWIALSGLFTVGENDELQLNQKYYLVMKDHIDKLKDAGVENFLMLYSSYLHPTGYVPTTGYVVPNPREEYNEYIRFLNIQKEAAKRIKTLFPEIRNFEPGNEPDFANPGCIHKNGYVFGGDLQTNQEFLYNDDDKTSIIADLCWYTRQGIKEVDKDARVAIPGLANGSDQTTYTPDFLDLIYERIESKCLPAGQEYSDTNPDNYFDIVNYHPYPNQTTLDGFVNWDAWISYNKEIYDVVKKHNDNGKEVYFSELGWTDFGIQDEETLNRIAGNYETAFSLIKQELPWVTAVFPFRLTNLKYQALDTTGGEENFGLFYHPEDSTHPGQPKPAAITVSKIYNGEKYDIYGALL